ncbi:YxeA family protein [Actinomycetaceae bacterium MB13-C1-2]|nr:YxeA family protein [Actinomycetaceae bacterium MB13-C1-2]
MSNSSSGAKNLGKTIVLVALVAIVAVGAYFGKTYYDDRYVGETFYAQVPLNEPVTVHDLYDAEGNPVDKGYTYSLTGVSEKGEQRLLEFDLHSSNPADLYQPGTYLRAKASNQLVVHQEAIDESQVPDTVLKNLAG